MLKFNWIIGCLLAVLLSGCSCGLFGTRHDSNVWVDASGQQVLRKKDTDEVFEQCTRESEQACEEAWQRVCVTDPEKSPRVKNGCQSTNGWSYRDRYGVMVFGDEEKVASGLESCKKTEIFRRYRACSDVEMTRRGYTKKAVHHCENSLANALGRGM